MADVSVDQSKLPGVKEVCRDFAVLEDHTLAHSLQEQEIEHHLASNIQRNRLVQHDLQVAKQLQEEDLKAQAQLQKRYKAHPSVGRCEGDPSAGQFMVSPPLSGGLCSTYFMELNGTSIEYRPLSEERPPQPHAYLEIE